MFTLKNKEAFEGESVLVQGVIDCLYEDENGELILFDYKTDRVDEKLAKDRDRVKEIMTERHGTQLKYYKIACEKIFKKNVSKIYIYPFDAGYEVEIPV